ncbi:MAG: hypothetical protein QME74_06400 [Candidatus Edwardsbacteria bacterium]|nr:hypothetical protein [Candidatus Edwardsbacteria bacterium]
MRPSTLPARGRSAWFFLLAPVILAFATVANGQTRDIMFSPFLDFYSENRLALGAGGRGYAGVATSGDISATLLNPASLQADSALSFSFGYAYKSDLPWLRELWADVGEMNVRMLNPCLLAGVGHRFGNSLQTGIVYYDRFSYRFDMGDQWHTGPNGEDLGRFHTYQDIRVSVVSIPLSYRLSDVLTLGLSADLGFYRNVMHWSKTYSRSFWHGIPRMGLLVGPIQRMSLGMSFEPKTTATYEYEIPSEYQREDTDMLETLTNVFPARFSMGLAYQLPDRPLSLYLDFRHAWMSEIDHALKNRQDVHLGIEYETPSNTLRAGFFTLDDYRVGYYYALDSKAGSAHQYFLTAGITTKGRIPMTISIMDSHILSRGEWKTTMVTVGFNFQR